MAALVNHIRYNTLPSLDEASVSCQALSVDDIVNGPVRNVFLKYAVHTTFCLYLMHRHHSVKADETVVKVEGTAHMMNSQTIKDIASFGNKVVPTIWMTSGGQVLPMEAVMSVPVDAFVLELLSVLTLNRLGGLFGIDTIAKSAWTEMSIGDASVVVPSNASDSYDHDKFIPVAFTFDEENPKFKIHGKYGKGEHKHSSKPK